MEINDIRRKIFGYLRDKPKLKCTKCNDVLIWDKPLKRIYNLQLENDITAKFCYQCYLKEIGNPDLFTVIIIFLFLIYICFLIILCLKN